MERTKGEMHEKKFSDYYCSAEKRDTEYDYLKQDTEKDKLVRRIYERTNKA